MNKMQLWKSQQALKNKRTALQCKQHGIQTVVEYKPDGTVKLACECERKLFSSDCITTYESEKKARSGHRRVSGNAVSTTWEEK
jgi:hypothetical protein